MAISTYADYEHKMRSLNTIQVHKAMANSGAGVFSSSWTRSAGQGVAPTTAVACDNTLTGALNQESTVGNSGVDFRLVRAVVNVSNTGNVLWLLDRLSHQGGLDGTLTTTQTTNLPTAALTRYTTGEGVWAAVEIYVAVGTTATTFTCSYTNQAGVSGRTSKPQVIGGTGNNAIGKLIVIQPQDGDTGIRSVESVTLAGSTVSAAGNFGITLFKPLSILHPVFAGAETYGANSYNALIGGGGQFEPILPNSCLFLGASLAAAVTNAVALSFMEVS